MTFQRHAAKKSFLFPDNFTFYQVNGPLRKANTKIMFSKVAQIIATCTVFRVFTVISQNVYPTKDAQRLTDVHSW